MMGSIFIEPLPGTRMTQRSANYAIKGYLYQFCKTIEQILSSTDGTEITVEGIEDIDLSAPDATSLIQCKYHQETRFTPSATYKPVGLMLKHLIEGTREVSSYTLYAHFNENSPANTGWITDEFLRKALTHIDANATATDTQLASFKAKFHFITGMAFDELQRSVHTLLQSAFNCTAIDVELYYYNIAIAHMVEVSARTDINQRRIKKATFQTYINKKYFLFDIWQHELEGKQAYIKAIKKRLKSAKALADTKRRFLFISREMVNNPTAEISLNTLLNNLVNQYGIVGKLYNSALWTVIIDAEPTQIQETKAYLVKNGIYFNDGYEAVSFCGRYFNDMPITNKKRTSDKIAKTSHNLRLLSATTFRDKFAYVVDTDKYPHVFINTTRSLHNNQFFLDNPSIGVYRLAALDNLADLNEILKRAR